MDPILLGAPFITAFAIIGIRKYYKKTWRKIQIPFMIVISILSAFVISVITFASYTMIHRTIFSPIEKILYCVICALIIAIFVYFNISGWKKVKKELRKND